PRRRIHHESNISLVGIQLGVETHPNLRALLPDRRNQDRPRTLRYRSGLLHPADINALIGLDGFDRLGTKTGKQELGPVHPSNLGLQDLVDMPKPHRLNLIAQETMNRVLDGLLNLTSAEDS